MERKTIKVHVWGKQGCTKCEMLLKRLKQLNEDGMGLDIEYHDVKTVKGLAEFCRHGSINGNNIPAMTVEGDLEPIDPKGWPWKGSLPLYGEFGVCTDYDTGGVMRPDMLVWVFDRAVTQL